MEEKNLEELEEKSTTPPPAEPVSLPQEPPKVRSEKLFRPLPSLSYLVSVMKHVLNYLIQYSAFFMYMKEAVRSLLY